MTSRRHLGLSAGVATLLAALPLSTIFDSWTWFVQSVIVVACVTGAGTLARVLRAPAWGQFLAMAAGLLGVLTLLAPDSGAVLGLVPTTDTFARFGELLNQAGVAMREMGVPVDDHDGLLFLTAVGIGAVAVCTDLCAVALRRPALAGLPMLAIYSVPVAVHQDSVSVLPFVAGAAGFLWLLVTDNVDRVRRFGRRFTGDGRDLDRWEPSPLAAAGRRMAIVGMLAAVLLPIAVPGMTTGLLDRFGTGGDGTGSGPGRGGRQVNLWALLEGTLNQDEETELALVTTSDPNPGYLRFGVADELSRDGFRNRPPSGRTSAADLPDPRQYTRRGLAFREETAQVEIVDFAMNLLPVYSTPLRVDGLDSRWLYDEQTQVIYAPRANTAGEEYRFTYVRAEYSADALRAARPLPADVPFRRFNTGVPNGVREVETLVAELTAGRTTDYDKVRALYDFFSIKNGFEYSLQAVSDTGGAAIVDFLAPSGRRGYCVQYAAALAWMVREAGIPARVAFGFTRGTETDDDRYRLTNRNLHAWTEVYFDGFGWVPFDATPSASVIGSVDPSWAPNPDAPQLTPGGPGATPGPGPTASVDPNDPRSADDLPFGDETTGEFGPLVPTSPRWPEYLAASALLALVLLAMPAVRRALLRRRRRAQVATAVSAAPLGEAPPGEPRVVVPGGAETARTRRDAHAAWDELIDTLVDFQLPVDLAETPRTTAERIVRQSALDGEAAQGARLLGRAEERARYARVPLVTGDLGRSLRAVRRALAGDATRGVRLRAVLLPPSVLMRWRQALTSGTTTVVATTGRWVDAVARTVSLRRLLLSRGTR